LNRSAHIDRDRVATLQPSLALESIDYTEDRQRCRHCLTTIGDMTVPEAVREMLSIVEKLCAAYPKKRFTLDGRLVGDIGEVLVEEAYDLKLFENLKRHHDAQCGDGRLVQIKATMKNTLTFPADHVPDYYLGVQVRADGTFVEVFNGPGAIACEAVKGRSSPKNNLHSVSISALVRLQGKVTAKDRVPLRRNAEVQPAVAHPANSG
jgi:hypothetical protein